MNRILHVIVKDQMAGAETVVSKIINDNNLKISKEFKVLILSKFWKSKSVLFPQNTVSIIHVIFNSWVTIHTHLFWGGLFGYLISWIKPKTNWLHSLHYCSYEGLRLKSIKQFIDHYFVFKNADAIHIVSSACKTILNRTYRVYLIENYPAEFEIHKNKGSSADQKIKILTTAFFRKEKGLDRIITLAAQMKNANILFIWTICGNGPLFVDFKKKIDSLGLTDNFNLVGFQNNLKQYYLSADLYIQPSYSESFGLALLEAIQYSIPILASDVGNIPSLLNNGQFGHLVHSNANWSEQAYKIILKYTKDPAVFHKMSEAAADYYLEKVCNYNASEMWNQLYDRKTLIFCSPLTTQATGGIQKQLYLQTKELSKLYDIIIIQRQDDQIQSHAAKWDHVKFRACYYVENTTSKSLIDRLNGILFIIHGLWHILKIKNVKAIHALQMYSPTILAVLAKFFHKCRVVVKVTASGALGEVNQLSELPFIKARRYIFRYVDKFLALTESMKSELILFGIRENKIRVIPNSVEIQSHENFKSLDLNFFQVLYVGRISNEKSLETLLLATIMLANHFPQNLFSLKIVGGIYPQRNNYEDLLKISLQSPANLKITFTGFQENAEDHYRNASIFILPSTSEGMSNSLLEALSFGLPCIVSDIAANLDLVTNEFNGLTFQVKNTNDLFQKMHRLYVDRIEKNLTLSKSLSSTAKLFIQKNYSAKSVCEKLNETYQNQ